MLGTLTRRYGNASQYYAAVMADDAVLNSSSLGCVYTNEAVGT